MASQGAAAAFGRGEDVAVVQVPVQQPVAGLGAGLAQGRGAVGEQAPLGRVGEGRCRCRGPREQIVGEVRQPAQVRDFDLTFSQFPEQACKDVQRLPVVRDIQQ